MNPVNPERPVFSAEDEPLAIKLPNEVDEGLLPALTAQELDVLDRRDLVLRATEDLENVLDTEVRIPHLLAIASEEQASFARLRARRALRCLQQIGVENSVVVRTVGEANLYHYVEGVMNYGASRATYLGLIEQFGLNPEQATGLYELREQIADYTDGSRIGFPTLHRALEAVGMSVEQAAEDVESALVAFNRVGFFISHEGSKVYDHDIFRVRTKPPAPLGPDIDTQYAPDSQRWVQDYVDSKKRHDFGLDRNEAEDEGW